MEYKLHNGSGGLCCKDEINAENAQAVIYTKEVMRC